tara:strand:+ start:5511 stop:6971 length:1461 start_codon:yes stop_codon:yes gene_type:complete
MPFILGASSASDTVHQINQSIRFNDSDSPILKKTLAAGTDETFTFSCWVKRGKIGSGLGGAGNYGLTLFSGGSDTSNYGEIRFESSGFGTQDSLFFYNLTSGSINYKLATTQLFRDTSAWYHIVCVMDTTNASETERMRIYVNGLRVTDFSAISYPGQNDPTNFNTATEHGVGGFAVGTDTRFFDGYLAEIVFLDGTATTCNSFGEFNSSGIWVPKDVSGLTFGTNGFHIDGRDATDLGDDEAGSNDFAASGLAEHDQVSDSPTNNFPTLNPLNKYGSNVSLSDGNLTSTVSSSSNHRGAKATQAVASGKWYFEVYFSASNADNNGAVAISESSEYNDVPGETSDPTGFRYGSAGNFKQNNVASSVITTIAAKDIVMVALDMDNDKAWIGINGAFVSSGDPASGSNAITTTVPDLAFPVSYHYSTTATEIFNFGQDSTFSGLYTQSNSYVADSNNYVGASDGNGVGSFFYTPPTGYLAICTKNLGS